MKLWISNYPHLASVSLNMGYKSPAQIIRAVRRITKFLEHKIPALVLSKIVLPSIDIAPVYPKLSITHVQTTIVPSTSETILTKSCLKNLPVAVAPLVDPLSDGVQPDTVADLTQPAVTDETKTLTHREFIAMMENFKNNIFKPP